MNSQSLDAIYSRMVEYRMILEDNPFSLPPTLVESEFAHLASMALVLGEFHGDTWKAYVRDVSEYHIQLFLQFYRDNHRTKTPEMCSMIRSVRGESFQPHTAILMGLLVQSSATLSWIEEDLASFLGEWNGKHLKKS